MFGMELKSKIEAVTSGECDYEKDYMEIKFNSDDDLPLKKPLKFYMITIICLLSDLFLKKMVNFIRKFF